jgi:hypothetical protein
MSDVNQKIEKLALMEEERGTVIEEGEDEREIKEYLLEELESVIGGSEREEMLQMVERWRRQREARPEEKEKDFPWEKASNIVPPLAMQDTNAIFALGKGAFSRRRPSMTVEGENPKLKLHGAALTAILDVLNESRHHANLRGQMDTIIYETSSLGTQFVKVPWTVSRWNFKRRNRMTGAIEQVSKVVKDCPEVLPIRFEDFLTRPFWSDLQRAPWTGRLVWLMKHELQQREAGGLFRNVEEVLSRSPDEIDEQREKVLARMGLTPDIKDSGMYAIAELNVFWDIDGDGYPEDIIVWIDPETGVILRSEFNDLGIRDIVRIPYLDRPYELYGMGIGWMLDQLQDAMTSVMNMYIDGTMLSMLQMYVSRKGSSIGPGEKFRPLKHIQTDGKPSDDFMVVKFPDITYGAMQLIGVFKEFGDRAVGANDYNLGFENRSIGTRGTATGTMFLAQQGSKLSSAIRETMEGGIGEIGQLEVFQLVRNRERAEELFPLIDEKHVPYLQEVLDMNVEDIPTSFRYRVETTEIERTEEARQEAKLKMMELYTLYSKQVFETLPVVYNPQVPQPIREVAEKIFIGETNLMEDLFRYFGEEETESYLPYVGLQEMLQRAIERQKEQMVSQIERRMGERREVSESGGAVPASPAGGGGFSGVPEEPGVPGGEGIPGGAPTEGGL